MFTRIYCSVIFVLPLTDFKVSCRYIILSNVRLKTGDLRSLSTFISDRSAHASFVSTTRRIYPPSPVFSAERMPLNICELCACFYVYFPFPHQGLIFCAIDIVDPTVDMHLF